MTIPRPEPSPMPLRREILLLVLAIVMAPLAVPLLALSILLVTGTVPTGQDFYKWSFFVIAIPYTYAVGAVVGLPLYFIFRCFRWRAWWHYALAGIFCAYVFAEYVGTGQPSMKFHLFFSFYGVVTACTAWAIAVRRWKPKRVEWDKSDNSENTSP